MSRCIAIDTMGGDSAPEEIIKGLAEFEKSDFSFMLFGPKEVLSGLVDRYLSSDVHYEIVNSSDVVGSDMPVNQALRLSKTSSMGMAISSVKNGDADVVVSAGNTGAYMASAKIILKTINGIDRPAIATTIPGAEGKSIMLDLGANSECSMRNMLEFAIMGDALARSIFAKDNPSISLLNIGSENIKGHPLIRSSADVIQKVFGNYVGYVEGNDIVRGVVDVIVCDGFSGNIALKSIEGTARVLLKELRSIFKSGILSKVAASMLLTPLKAMATKYDPRVHNGAILLGLNGLVVKSHGNSDALGTASAVKFAMRTVSDNVLDKIKSQMDKDLSLDRYLS